jgi:membrane fusion protein (multidrug efflux system)
MSDNLAMKDSAMHTSHRTYSLWTPLLLSALLFTACGEDSKPETTTAAEVDTRRIINVEVAELQSQDFHDAIRLTGTVMADRMVDVAAEEGGTVSAVLVDKGTMVTLDQILLRLDNRLLRAERNDANAQSKLAHEMWKRVRDLYEKDGIGTKTGYLEARYTTKSAAARLELIEERLRRLTIRAPFAGILDTRMVEVGSVVAPGQAIGRIVDLEPLKVAAGIPERYAADVGLGAIADVSFGDDELHGAKVSYVGATVHAGNRTFSVEFEMQSPLPGMKPEMVADVLLERRMLVGVIIAPRQALVRMEAGHCAFVVRGSGDNATAEVRYVTLGASANDQVVVTSGLVAGDRLVVVGQNQVAGGDRVRIVKSR